MADDDARRALSFGAAADLYDRHRPGPSAAVVQWLLPAGAGTAVDIGAGTGALTRRLVPVAGRVVAVEPDPRMAAVLAGRVPEALVVGGRAEALPLGDACADAVVGSSMWHWVDEARAGAEAARVLRPGGVLGVVWSGPDRRAGWLAEVLGPGRRPAAPPHRRRVDLDGVEAFGPPEVHRIRWTVTVAPDDLVGLAQTYSRVILLPAERRAALARRVADVIGRHPALAGRSAVELPMAAVMWRFVRR